MKIRGMIREKNNFCSWNNNKMIWWSKLILIMILIIMIIIIIITLSLLKLSQMYRLIGV